MITLNDYLKDGHTVPKVLSLFVSDLREDSLEQDNEVDKKMSSFFLRYNELLQRSRTITDQSNKLLEFYKAMVNNHPEFTYTFSGRLKSLYRSYLKYNRYIMNFIYDYHLQYGSFPTAEQINSYIDGRYRDICGYKFTVNIPLCRVEGKTLAEKEKNKKKKEEQLIYEIANALPEFLERNNFDVLPASSLSDVSKVATSTLLNSKVQQYYKNYFLNKNSRGYRAFHIAADDLEAGISIEIQLTTWEDNANNILVAKHDVYEIEQRSRAEEHKECMECAYYKDALLRTQLLYDLPLEDIKVDMFTVVNSQVCDGAGFLKARAITPHEHLSENQIL